MFFFYILLHTPAGNIEILWIVTGLTTCSLILRAQDCMFIWHPLALCCVLFSSWCFCKRAFQRCSSNHLKELCNNNNMLLLARLSISNCVKWLCKWKRWIRMHLFWRKNYYYQLAHLYRWRRFYLIFRCGYFPDFSESTISLSMFC